MRAHGLYLSASVQLIRRSGSPSSPSYDSPPLPGVRLEKGDPFHAGFRRVGCHVFLLESRFFGTMVFLVNVLFLGVCDHHRSLRKVYMQRYITARPFATRASNSSRLITSVIESPSSNPLHHGCWHDTPSPLTPTRLLSSLPVCLAMPRPLVPTATINTCYFTVTSARPLPCLDS